MKEKIERKKKRRRKGRRKRRKRRKKIVHNHLTFLFNITVRDSY